MKKFLILAVIFLAACNSRNGDGRYDYGNGVTCNQLGTLTTVTIYNDGRVEPLESQYQLTPPAQKCQINQDGSITVFTNLTPPGSKK